MKKINFTRRQLELISEAVEIVHLDKLEHLGFCKDERETKKGTDETVFHEEDIKLTAYEVRVLGNVLDKLDKYLNGV